MERDVHLIEIFKVGSKGCEVEGVIPLPRGGLDAVRVRIPDIRKKTFTYALVIVLQDPSHTLDITAGYSISAGGQRRTPPRPARGTLTAS